MKSISSKAKQTLRLMICRKRNLHLVCEHSCQEDPSTHICLIAGLSTNPQYINSLEHTVKTNTTREVHFDSRYQNPNLQFVEETTSWVPIITDLIK